jgi:hypothetical protein
MMMMILVMVEKRCVVLFVDDVEDVVDEVVVEAEAGVDIDILVVVVVVDVDVVVDVVVVVVVDDHEIEMALSKDELPCVVVVVDDDDVEKVYRRWDMQLWGIWFHNSDQMKVR